MYVVCLKIFIFGISFSLFSQKILSKSLIKPFVATYKKEQKFSFSRHKVHSDGVIFYQKDKMFVSEFDGRIGSFLKINNKLGILKTISKGKKISKRVNVSSINNLLFRILEAKSLKITINNNNTIKYYFYDKDFKYAVLEKYKKTGKIKSLAYEDVDDTFVKIIFYWVKFI